MAKKHRKIIFMLVLFFTVTHIYSEDVYTIDPVMFDTISNNFNIIKVFNTIENKFNGPMNKPYLLLSYYLYAIVDVLFRVPTVSGIKECDLWTWNVHGFFQVPVNKDFSIGLAAMLNGTNLATRGAGDNDVADYFDCMIAGYFSFFDFIEIYAGFLSKGYPVLTNDNSMFALEQEDSLDLFLQTNIYSLTIKQLFDYEKMLFKLLGIDYSIETDSILGEIIPGIDYLHDPNKITLSMYHNELVLIPYVAIDYNLDVDFDPDSYRYRIGNFKLLASFTLPPLFSTHKKKKDSYYESLKRFVEERKFTRISFDAGFSYSNILDEELYGMIFKICLKILDFVHFEVSLSNNYFLEEIPLEDRWLLKINGSMSMPRDWDEHF